MMAELDEENKKFTDNEGHTFSLWKKVMCPRTSGGYSPGWILDEYGYDNPEFWKVHPDFPVMIILNVEGKNISYKRVRVSLLKECAVCNLCNGKGKYIGIGNTAWQNCPRCT